MVPGLDGDLVKIALLSGAATVLYLLARHLSRAPGPSDISATLDPDPIPFPTPERPAVPLVGHEIPFPFDIRELEAEYGPGFVRPNILNYYFRHTDIVTGPPDAEDFYDELFVELENPEQQHRWTASFRVATPKGLERVMREDHSEFVYGEGTIILRRFHLAAIMRAVLERFAEPNDPLFKANQIAAEDHRE